MTKLPTDYRYSLFAQCAAQHLRAVASRLEARGEKCSPFPLHQIYWRRRQWLPFYPALPVDELDKLVSNPFSLSKKILQKDVAAWLSGCKKNTLDQSSAPKLRAFAALIEKCWLLLPQESIWHKSPTSLFRGYLFNIAQQLHISEASLKDTFPYKTNFLNILLMNEKNQIKDWLNKVEARHKVIFTLANVDVSKIQNQFLAVISLETTNGQYISDAFYLSTSDCSFIEKRMRVQKMIGYI